MYSLVTTKVYIVGSLEIKLTSNNMFSLLIENLEELEFWIVHYFQHYISIKMCHYHTFVWHNSHLQLNVSCPG